MVPERAAQSKSIMACERAITDNRTIREERATKE